MAAPWERYAQPQSPLASPTLPYQAPQAATNLQKSQVETRIATDTAAAQEAKAKAEAETAQLAAKTAAEQWAINHPQAGSTASMSGPQYLHYLQTTNPGRAAYIQGLAEGRIPFPSAQMMRSPAGQALLTDVMRADPTIDATNYATRAAARKSAAVGGLGQSDNALITAVGHAARLKGLVPDVFGSSVHPLNSVANEADSMLFNGRQPAYDQNAQLLGDEVAAAYGTNSQGKQNEAGSQFSSTLSTKQKLDNIHGAMDLLASKLAANRAQFVYGNGGLSKPDFMLLPAETRQELMTVAPDVAQKYFAGVPSMPRDSDGGDGGDAPPPMGDGPTTPNSAGPSGPQMTVATGPTRNEFDPVTSAGLAALIRNGRSFEEANAYAKSHGYPGFDDPAHYAQVQQYAAGHPDYQPAIARKEIPTTAWNRFAASPVGAGLSAAVAGGTAGLSDVAGRALLGPQWDANRQAVADLHPDADLIGNVAGSTAGMFGARTVLKGILSAGGKGGLARNAVAWALKNPIKAGALGDATYGGAYGASENPDAPIAGAGIGALTGGLTGLGAPVVSNAVGGAVRGVVNPAVQRLRAAGIPLTVGEVLGGGAKKAQDALTSVFGPGNMVERRYADGRAAFNQAAFDQAGAPIGATSFATGQRGIQALNAAKSQAYSNALNPVSLNVNTPDFINGMGSALQTANQIPAGELPQGYAASAINRFVGNQIADDGTMSGPAFQLAYRGLAKTANRASPKVEGHDIGEALGQAKDTLASTLQAQNPDAYQGFLNANTANRNLNVLSTAVNAAKNQDGQLFTPAQLGMAATNNARSLTGNIAAASGQRPFNQLAMDGQQIMSSRLPDSGTATRALVTGDLLTSGGILGGLAGVGGAEGYRQGGTGGMFGGAMAPLGLLTLLGTRGGQKLLVRGLIDRPAAAQKIGSFMLDNPALMGQIGTGFSTPLIAQQ